VPAVRCVCWPAGYTPGAHPAGSSKAPSPRLDVIEVLIVTGAANARAEAANTGIKQINGTGRGYRNADNYRARILLAGVARAAA
jgi:hypothetical protein